MKNKKSFKQIIKSPRPTLVDFYATWCGPCKMMNPVLKEVSSSVKGRARILKVDVDKNQRLAQSLNVRSVPTLIIYKNGKIVWRHSGMNSAHSIQKALEPFLEKIA